MNKRGWLTGCGVSRTAADWGRMGLVVLAAIACAWQTGCSRQRYRLQADRDAYEIVAGKSFDPRWALPQYTIEMDSAAATSIRTILTASRCPSTIRLHTSTCTWSTGCAAIRTGTGTVAGPAGKPSLVRSSGRDRSHE